MLVFLNDGISDTIIVKASKVGIDLCGECIVVFDGINAEQYPLQIVDFITE